MKLLAVVVLGAFFVNLFFICFLIKRNHKVKAVIDKVETDLFYVYQSSVRDLDLISLVDKEIKERLELEISQKKEAIAASVAYERMQIVADEWFASFTEKNFDEMMKEKLKEEAKRKLQGEFDKYGQAQITHY